MTRQHTSDEESNAKLTLEGQLHSIAEKNHDRYQALKKILASVNKKNKGEKPK